MLVNDMSTSLLKIFKANVTKRQSVSHCHFKLSLQIVSVVSGQYLSAVIFNAIKCLPLETVGGK